MNKSSTNICWEIHECGSINGVQVQGVSVDKDVKTAL